MENGNSCGIHLHRCNTLQHLRATGLLQPASSDWGTFHPCDCVPSSEKREFPQGFHSWFLRARIDKEQHPNATHQHPSPTKNPPHQTALAAFEDFQNSNPVGENKNGANNKPLLRGPKSS